MRSPLISISLIITLVFGSSIYTGGVYYVYTYIKRTSPDSSNYIYINIYIERKRNRAVMVFATALNCCQLYLPGRRPVLRRGIRCSSVSAASTNFDLKTYWATLIKEINQKLDEAIPVQYPHQIYEAMRYSVLAKGAKRAPPIMCVSACELFGGNRLAAFPTACALEMVPPPSFSFSNHVFCVLAD